MKTSRRLALVAKLVFTGGFLYFIFTIVPFSEVIGAIRAARLREIALALPLVLLAPFISAARLKVLTDAQGMSISVPRIARINFMARFYGLVLPGQLVGGVIRWHKIKRLEGKSAETLAAIVYARLVLLEVMIFLGVVFLLVELPREVHPVSIASLVILFVLLLAGAYLSVRADRSRLLGWLSGRRDSFLGRLASATGRYRHLSAGRWAMVSGITIVENLVGLLIVYLLAASLAVAVPLVTLGWVRSVIETLTMLPISISGLGVREGGLLVLLEPYGVTGRDAVALSFLMLGRGVLVALIGGLLELKQLLSRY